MAWDRGCLLGARDQSIPDGKLVIEDSDCSRRKVPNFDDGAKGLLQSIFYRRQPVFSMTVDYKHKTHVKLR